MRDLLQYALMFCKEAAAVSMASYTVTHVGPEGPGSRFK